MLRTVAAKLPSSLRLFHAASDGVGLFPSLLGNATAVWPTQDYLEDEVVLRLSDFTWTAAPDGPPSQFGAHFVLRFESAGRVTLSLWAALSRKKDILAHMHFLSSDASVSALPTGVIVLKSEWVFSTSASPQLILTAASNIHAFAGEFAVMVGEVSAAGGHGRSKRDAGSADDNARPQAKAKTSPQPKAAPQLELPDLPQQVEQRNEDLPSQKADLQPEQPDFDVLFDQTNAPDLKSSAEPGVEPRASRPHQCV